MRVVRTALLSALIAGISTGCGGGGGGGSPPPPPPPPPLNTAPVFTSGGTASVRENAFATVYRAQATDPEGTVVTLSVSGGADASRFALTASTGELRFVTPPDFEAPADANANNVYEVNLSASDGVNSTVLPLQITVTNDPGTYRVRRVATGLTNPVQVVGYADGSGRVIVAERGGRFRLLDPATGAFAASDVMNLAGEEILGLAVSPTFLADRYIYISTLSNSNPNAIGLEVQIRRFQVTSVAAGQVDVASNTLILEINQTLGETQNMGGMLAFDRDGNLVIGTGFGRADPLGGGTAQGAISLMGKLLRIDVRTTPYSAPAGNAFLGGVGGSKEIWALGLRNPYRGSVDPVTGNIFVGDQGQAAREEVDRINYGTNGPINFGWNLREGTQPFNGGADSASFTMPVAEYAHGAAADQGDRIIGGEVYRGPVDKLQGLYVFADAVSNNIWSAPAASLTLGATLPASSFTLRNADFAPDAGTIDGLADIGRDQNGNLYFVGGGEIFRLEPTP